MSEHKHRVRDNRGEWAGSKRATNVSVSATLLDEARALEINLSATLESALRERVREARRARWLQDNRGAITVYNQEVEGAGVFSDGIREF